MSFGVSRSRIMGQLLSWSKVRRVEGDARWVRIIEAVYPADIGRGIVTTRQRMNNRQVGGQSVCRGGVRYKGCRWKISVSMPAVRW